jgi:hypothetical protein
MIHRPTHSELETVGEITAEHLAILAQLLVDLAEAHNETSQHTEGD